MRLQALLAVVVATACVVPRNYGMGVNMQPLAPGQVEAAVAAGASYSTRTNGPCCQTQLAFPVMEANVAVGLSPAWTFNLHGGPAGVEPGFRYRASAGPLDLGILVDVGAGILDGEGSMGIGFLGAMFYLTSRDGSYLSLSNVARVIVASDSAPIGEDDLMLAGGYAVKAGPVTFRPEAGLVWNALSSQLDAAGPVWEVFAGLSVSIRSSP